MSGSLSILSGPVELTSDEAFADVVRRHIGWVHGVARRRLRDPHAAEDVTQAVFILLHRKAPRFDAERALVSWLHRTARYATEVALRAQRRRSHHEKEAAAVIAERTSESSSEWDELAPLLDDLIGKLSRDEREAVLLRYYRNMTFAQVGAEMQTSEDAARKRVERAVAKLREFASSQIGATVPAAALLSQLEICSSATSPPGFIASTVGASTASGGSAITASSATIVKGTIAIMTATKAASIAAAAAALFLLGGAATYLSLGHASLPDPPPVPELPAPPRPPALPRPARPPALPAVPAAEPRYEKLAPFTDVRWLTNQAAPQIQVDGQWYVLLSINDKPIDRIVDFCKTTYDDRWQKRFAEDLVEVLAAMGHPSASTVRLEVRKLDSPETIVLPAVPMTKENRRAVWELHRSDAL